MEGSEERERDGERESESYTVGIPISSTGSRTCFCETLISAPGTSTRKVPSDQEAFDLPTLVSLHPRSI